MMGLTMVVLVCFADDSISSGIQYSPKLVGDGLGRPSENGVAVVHTCYATKA